MKYETTYSWTIRVPENRANVGSITLMYETMPDPYREYPIPQQCYLADTLSRWAHLLLARDDDLVGVTVHGIHVNCTVRRLDA